MDKSKKVGFICLGERIIMGKILISCLVLLNLSVTANANQISHRWNKTYGGSYFEIIGPIQQTSDGGYILGSSTSSFGPGMYSFMALKLNSNGEITWQRLYAASNYFDTVYSVQQTLDGGYVLAGSTFPASSHTAMALIVKLDNQGDIIWAKTYSEIVELKSIQQTSDEGYIACGGGHMLKLDKTGDNSWYYEIPQAYPTFTVDLDKILQTTDGGYIASGYVNNNRDFDILILKLDNDGNIVWQKTYGNNGTEHGIIHQLSDGEYFITGYTSSFSTGIGVDALLLKLNSSGAVLWQKIFDGSYYDCGFTSIQKTSDEHYLVGGDLNSYEPINSDLWVLKLASNGDIVWQKTYGGSENEGISSIQKTCDGGYVVQAYTESFGAGATDIWVLKLDNEGDIPDCEIINYSDAIVFDTTILEQDSDIPLRSSLITVADASIIPLSVSVDTSTVCYYVDPNDIDGDGVENNPVGPLTGSMSSSLFLTEEDNCSEIPNGPHLGTCTKGNVGGTCIADEACGVDGVCSMNQEDTYPASGNGIGDACDCEGNFNCDEDCDGTDAATFKIDFGRSAFENPCNNESQCHGDIDCDEDVDGTDAALFKEDFGRSTFNNPCPACVVGKWCVYP
jgi:hypothetical protein